ncbi:hypothetical protein UB43_10675 [Pseudomonas sp. 21]|uniref:DUF3509 domain-containing protein n=1 Tax=Pseudomonas TaxID=286 RepID=UPI0005EAF8A1|nr:MULTISPECIES: DUF3509 domain-containing protein [Pseudomonas]KJK00870.1 hypothetical protein UB43_10675 [Pseudomonas sp. 21]MBV7581752.1 DUF3509 domain-containing protein [Pseudomonas sp. PDM33]MCE4071306.1 DUF3509 domain-containing protein [Pseudomonas nitritireducens]MCE4080811.1 DUF3509 domain-containing protein [Pseudomonas nitroreducens]OBY90848.1 hypothetical protein A6723_021740 [Pseudomonas sp. AU11447]
MDRLSALLTETFAPYAPSLGPARPDGGRILTLTNDEGDVVLRRVIEGQHLADHDQSAEAVQTIRRDLLISEGRMEDDVVSQLRQRAQVLSYGT